MSMTSEERGDGGMTEPFAPSNIVRLRRPYKVGDWWGERPPGFSDSGEGRAEWEVWAGYTHGVVAEVIERGHPVRLAGTPGSTGRTLPGPAVRVSLHLYDPARALLYIHDRYTVPAYVDFHVSELAPHKVATDEGYATLPALDNDGE